MLFLPPQQPVVTAQTNNEDTINPVPPQQRSFSEPRKTMISSGVVFQYKKSHHEEEQEESRNNDCVICLDKFEEGELCRVLDRCNHVYHRFCIDKWLFKDTHCPLCRSSVCHERTVDDRVLDQV
ncbi:RING-H2 finger protein ATL16-like [Tripterygium wilfordii]|uniref:RING-H2 finger protein ATL16-like n=1 Tax=Tripterygium wilfordii TaxID=458696 RepID=UPI0018F8638B|nr:RING-H2 finger protein ATL16-like [Tripterygium wilfordii]